MQKTKEHELMAVRVEQAKKTKTLIGLRSGAFRGSSVHFKTIKSAIHAVTHVSREAPPEYLLPEDKSQGTHIIIDDMGEVAARLEQKLSLASRQAKATKDYSPLWEGVLNMPEPSSACPVEVQKSIVSEWCRRYEAMTGHQVLRADLHLDEGHIDDHGEARINAHAHVMLDRTDDSGRVIKLSAPKLREIQTMTAEVTGLARGENALQSGRKHVGHQAFRYLAERGRLDPDHAKENAELRAEIERLKAEYAADREAMKATAEAKQRDYQALKEAHLKALDELKRLKAPPAKQAATEAEKLGAAYVWAFEANLKQRGIAPERIRQIIEKHTTDEERASFKNASDADLKAGKDLLSGPVHRASAEKRIGAVLDQEIGRSR